MSTIGMRKVAGVNVTSKLEIPIKRSSLLKSFPEKAAHKIVPIAEPISATMRKRTANCICRLFEVNPKDL